MWLVNSADWPSPIRTTGISYLLNSNPVSSSTHVYPVVQLLLQRTQRWGLHGLLSQGDDILIWAWRIFQNYLCKRLRDKQGKTKWR